MKDYSKKIQFYRKKINKSILNSLKKIRKDYSMHLVHPILFESIKEFSLREGKRIRPLLLILSYEGYYPKSRKPSQTIYNASTCMELLHNFMLIHDDIIDRSNLRRGKPTLHRLLRATTKTKDPDKLGYDLSIIAGDIVYAFAINAFLSIKEAPQRKERALKHFVKTAAFTAMGEFIDTVHGAETIERITEKDVFLNYTLKTAYYTFECPLVVGAILASAKETDIKKLSRFGIMMGQAFQIQDDILGVYSSQKSIGKSILSDLVESKKTLLICHAFHHLKLAEKKKFLNYFLKKKKAYKDLVIMRKMLIDSGSLSYSLKKMETLISQSQDIISQLTIRDSYRNVIWGSLLALFGTSQKIAQENSIFINLPQQ